MARVLHPCNYFCQNGEHAIGAMARKDGIFTTEQAQRDLDRACGFRAMNVLRMFRPREAELWNTSNKDWIWPGLYQDGDPWIIIVREQEDGEHV